MKKLNLTNVAMAVGITAVAMALIFRVKVLRDIVIPKSAAV